MILQLAEESPTKGQDAWLSQADVNNSEHMSLAGPSSWVDDALL
jgi:hypothetical protein